MQNIKHDKQASLSRTADSEATSDAPPTSAAVVSSGGKGFKAFLADESGTTTLEWLLLLGAIALPSVYIFTISLHAVVDYYRMMTTLNSLPFP